MSEQSIQRLPEGKAQTREVPLSDFASYTRHVDPWTVATEEGYLLQVVKVEGVAFETMDQADINHLKRVRNTLLMGLASSRFGLYSHVIRRRVSAHQPGDFEGFAKVLDDTWRRKLASKRLFVNDLYLTVVRRGLTGGIGVGERVARWFSGKVDEAAVRKRRAAELEALTEATDRVVSSLASYGARKIGVYETEASPLPHSEVLTFLGTLINLDRRPVALPEGPLKEHLTWKRLLFGRETVEVRGVDASDTKYAAMVTVREYAAASAPGMLDGLLRLPHELVISQSFGFVERQSALERIQKEQRVMRQTEDAAVSLSDQLSDAADDLMSNRIAFGEHHLTVLVSHATQDGLRDGLSEVNTELERLGLITTRCDSDLRASYFAQWPGNFSYITRGSLISTANFAGYASFHNFPQGKAKGNHWGDCITVLETTSGTPYCANTHVDDLGNFLVIGPAGTGKTSLQNFLIAQAQRFRPFTILFDKDRGAEIFVRALGGQYSVIQPGHRTGFNPLQIEDTKKNREFLRDWLELLVRPVSGEALSAEEREIVADAIDANFTLDKSHRRLRVLQELFEGQQARSANSLAARLAPWWSDGSRVGERAWLFDNETDRLSLDPNKNRTVGFDLTYILDDSVGRMPAVMYMLHRADQALDGRKAIVNIDEGWKVLDDPVFQYRTKDLFKTIRKRGGIVGFSTQSGSDALNSSISDAIIEQSPTQIFLPNHQASEAVYCGGFKLTRQELRTIRELPKKSRCFLWKHGAHSVIARLDLTGEDDLIAVLSGRTATVNLLDEIRKQVGDEPEDWMPIFQRRRHEQ